MPDPIVTEPLETLIAEFSRSGVRELHLRRDGFELYLSNDGSAPTLSRATMAAPQSAEAPSPSVSLLTSAASQFATLPEDAVVVHAPNLGTFYRAPKPGADVYVEVGSVVTAGAELCLIEVMKLFTAVQTETAGRIHAVLAEDGAMVEAGQPLFAIVNE